MVVCFLAISSLCFAQQKSPDEKTKQVSNEVIKNIFNEMLSSKEKYPELANFSEENLFENQYGIATISYEFQDADNSDLYEILVTVIGLQDSPPLQPQLEYKKAEFPILGLKVLTVTPKNKRARFFNLDKLVAKDLELLNEHQQLYLPLEIILKPEKDVYKVGERISFEVYVKNRTTQPLQINNLNEKSLFFTINNLEWGTNAATSDATTKDVIVKPNDIVKRAFKGDSFRKPGDVEIYCKYNVAYRGILPFGKVKIRIEP